MTEEQFISLVIAAVIGFFFIPALLGAARGLGIYAIVNEREAQVFTLFGEVLGTLRDPGLHFPVADFGIRALLVPFFGKRHFVSTRLRQFYLRDQMVNSEEGTPMGVGIFYEMQVTDPVAFLFNNADPDGSLAANVASATISTLSNLDMDKLLEDRHQLSRKVRAMVSPQSEKWGYKLGSVYIRKVSFTDREMVDNITDKVVKRLIQVTSAMKQDGENRVGLIQSQTAYKVSQQLAEAGAKRPAVVGDALNAVANDDPEVLEALMEVMETEQLLEAGAGVEVVPEGVRVLVTLGAEGPSKTDQPKEAATPRRVASFRIDEPGGGI